MKTVPESKQVEITCIVLYIAAIVAANFLVATFGQAALPFTAFALIPFDLVTRDVLHQRWEGNRLWTRMAALILCGAVLSASLNVAVAVASFVAFASSGLVNAGVYAGLRGSSRFRRMNVSNALAAITDSIVFPAIAFSAIDWRLSVAQSLSKFIGGLVLTWFFLAYIGARDADRSAV